MDRRLINAFEIKFKSASRNPRSAIPLCALLLARSISTVMFLALCSMLLAPCFPAEAQQHGKGPRIGLLMTSSTAATAPYIEAFRQGLRELGYVDGKNIVLEIRGGVAKPDRLTDLAADLVRSRVDIIVAAFDSGVRAAKNATRTIPIVMMGVGTDPVEAGLVESLARPGGNITGVTLLAVETSSKRPELLKEVVPRLTRVAVLYDPANRGNLTDVKQVQTVARPLGFMVRPWEVRGTDSFERVFAAMSKERPDGLYVAGGPLMNANEGRIARFALKTRLPSVYDRKEAVDAGGLMSYGANRVEPYRRAAVYVDKILKGTKPADLPVEQPTKFEFVISLKTAKRIGFTIPQSLLYRADKVIK